MRSLVILIALWFTSFATSADPASTPKDACVRVVHDLGGGYFNVGSGTVIVGWDNESYIITCHHVVKDGSKKVVVHHDGKVYTAEYIKSDVSKDLCLLRVKGVELPWVYVAKAEFDTKPGDSICQWGCCGTGNGFTAKAGKLLGFLGEHINGTGAPVFKTTTDARPGDSGCGVFKDTSTAAFNAAPRLVAVCWGGKKDGVGQACTGLKDIKAFLDLPTDK